MTYARAQRRLAQTLVLATATGALVAAAPSTTAACPLGGHDSPRVRLLHTLMQPRPHAGHAVVAQQSAPQTTTGPQTAAPPKAASPARTELGAYGRDLPRGAAAPSTDTKPSLRSDLGQLSWPASQNPEAQAYFDQGYRLGWGFNHAEAARAFRAAQDLDPTCALCLWGEAWVLGPHINYPMEPDANARALAALDQAKRLGSGAGEMQAALIDALSGRYSSDPNADRKALDQAYADAMEAVQARFPRDPHIAVLTADALMNLTPWDYWADGGRTAKPATARMVALLEGVLGDRQDGTLQAMPDHPGAIHLYIHTVEASDRPERAAAHAARLGALMPGAGHVVHMPSHIWYRLGRWRDSLDANMQAATADENLLRDGGASLLYSQGYYAHNVHFILASALMGGDGQSAVEAAEKLAGLVSDRAKREVPWTQPIAAAAYNAHALVSKPDTVLALPEPSPGFPYVTAAWHHARGMALARAGRDDEARAEVAAIEALAKSPEITAMPDGGVPGPDVLTITARTVEARIAQAEGDDARAAALLKDAAEIQDRLPYMEPPFWFYPVHQSLGAALLRQGKAEEAEAAFRDALKRSPNNGWAAAGLLRTAEARGDAKGVEEAKALMQRNWFGGEAPQIDQL